MPQKPNTVTIFGAGLVGSMQALLLRSIGYHVCLYDKRDLSHPKPNARSINLALSTRAWTALQEVGLEERVRAIGVAMKGRRLHLENGQQYFQAYGKEGQAIYSTPRNALNQLLLEEAVKKGVDLVDRQELDRIEGDTAYFKNGDAKDLQDSLIIGADGIHSAVRNSSRKAKGVEHDLGYQYLEFDMIPGAKGDWKMEADALHIWPRKAFMMIALPNADGSFTCTLFLPKKGTNSVEDLDSDEKIASFFTTFFPDFVTLVPDFETQLQQHPVSSLSYLADVEPFDGRVMLIGDAAHAIVPFYGQGMNAGFEDARLLAEQLKKSSSEEDLIAFARHRKKNGKAIMELALQNFIEMRDGVLDPVFQIRKQLEQAIATRFSTEWKSQYALVTFSNTPYCEAQETGEMWNAFLEQLIIRHDITMEMVQKNAIPQPVWHQIKSAID